MTKILDIWLAIAIQWLVPQIARAESRANLEKEWLHAVSVGVERYADANSGTLPSKWEDIEAHNLRVIEATTQDFKTTYGYSPLQVYALLPKAVSLAARPSSLVVMIRTREIVDTWKSSDGRSGRIKYRYLVYIDGNKKVHSEAVPAGDLIPIKSALDAVQPLMVSDPGFTEEESRTRAAREREVEDGIAPNGPLLMEPDPGNGNAVGERTGRRGVSYGVVAMISVLSAFIGALAIWVLHRR